MLEPKQGLVAPGKNESAGRNQSAKTVKGNRHLKALLVQEAHTVSRSNDNYLLRNGTHYREWGVDYFDKRDHEQVQRHLVKRLEQLGHKVTLEPLTT